MAVNIQIKLKSNRQPKGRMIFGISQNLSKI